MSLFLIALFVAVFIGIGLVLYAIYSFVNDKGGNGTFSYLELDNTIKAIDSSVQEADDAMEQLDKLAKSIFDEIDGKYQELLFLYTLIDEKKRSTAEDYSARAYDRSFHEVPDRQTYGQMRTNLVADDNTPLKKPITYTNPNLDKINELSRSGLSITEIAKNLNMGQGEVKLIMELGRAR